MPELIASSKLIIPSPGKREYNETFAMTEI